MTPIKRYVGAGSAAVLLAFSLSACGGAPTDASTKDFCEAYNSSADVFGDIDQEASPKEQAEAFADGAKEYADKLEEVGTPEGISDEAREGFEIQVEELGDLDADDIAKAIEDSDPELVKVSKDDEEKANAFDEYASKECASEAPTE